MALRRHTGTAGGVHRHLDLRQKRFCQQGVGDNADIGTQADQDNLLDTLVLALVNQVLAQFDRTKRRFHHGADGGIATALDGGIHPVIQFPAGGVLDAVGNRKDAALLGIQVVGLVGVLGYDDFAVKVLDFLTHRRHNGLGFAGAKSSVHKIFLHIDDNQHTHRLSSILIDVWI